MEGKQLSINGKLNPNTVYGVYFNYESDFNGDFDFLIGFEVEEGCAQDPSIEVIQIPASDCICLANDDPAPVYNKLPMLWSHVWQNNYKRKYDFDVEEYRLSDIMSENPYIRLYISVQ